MVKITGVEAHVGRLRGITGPQLSASVGKALYVGAQAIQTDAQISITTGAVSGRGHIPSRPGEPPNNDTSTLRNNIEAVSTGPLSAEVSSNAPYAAALEYGTSKIAERPYMRPAVARNKDEIVASVRAAVDRLVAKHS